MLPSEGFVRRTRHSRSVGCFMLWLFFAPVLFVLALLALVTVVSVLGSLFSVFVAVFPIPKVPLTYNLRRNLLGRRGWLQLLRLGIVDYGNELYLSRYDDESIFVVMYYGRNG